METSAVRQIRPRPVQPFVGRDALLDELTEKAEPGRRVLVTDAGPETAGAGKSQLVAEWLHRSAERFNMIWWVRGRDPLVRDAEATGLANALSLEGAHSHNFSVVGRSLMKALREMENWVVVFDDVTGAENLSPYIPLDGPGTIVAIAEQSDGAHEWFRMPVPPLTVGDGAVILRRHAQDMSEEDISAAIAQLGAVPFVLDVAGAYCTKAGISPKQLPELMKKREVNYRADTIAAEGKLSPIAALCGLALDAMESQRPGAVVLARLCAFLDSSDLTSGYILEGLEEENDWANALPRNEPQLAELFDELAAFRLVRPETGGYHMPTGVQRALRSLLPPKGLQQWAERAIGLANKAFPNETDYERQWPGSLRSLSHGAAATQYAEALHAGHEAAGALLNKMGLYARSCGALETAHDCLERALTLAKDHYGPSHETVAIRTHNLGLFLWEARKLDEARANLEEALAISAELHEYNEPDLTCLTNLCGLLEQLNDLETARNHYERALELYEKSMGTDDPSVATISSHLGRMLHQLGDYEAARANLERALAIDEKVFGPNHHKVALRLTFLGRVYADELEFTEARACFKRALKIHREFFGSDHPSVGRDCHNLAMICFEQEDFSSAKKFFKEALRLQEKHFGLRDVRVHDTVNQLAQTLRAMDAPEQAIPFYERLRAIYEQRKDGAIDEYLPNILVELALTYREMEDFDKAIEHANLALELRKEMHGAKHKHVARAHALLGRIHRAADNLDEARASYERARSIDTAVYGTNDEMVGRDLHNLGLVMKEQGDTISALACFKRAYEVFHEKLGASHSRTRQARRNMEKLSH